MEDVHDLEDLDHEADHLVLDLDHDQDLAPGSPGLIPGQWAKTHSIS